MPCNPFDAYFEVDSFVSKPFDGIGHGVADILALDGIALMMLALAIAGFIVVRKL